MRFIDNSSMHIPDDWLAAAALASEAVAKAAPDKRKETMKGIGSLWAELNGLLGNLSSGKCWYCESKQIRSDMPIDHFRPKNRIAEREDHPGYWWLVFVPSNYRYSCTYCNSRRIDHEATMTGGKGDHFPLFDEARRALTPDFPLNDEQPFLLDPTDPLDPGLLWVDEDGRAKPSEADAASWLFTRTERSVELYHLNHTDLIEARFGIVEQCRKLVANADEAYTEWAQTASTTSRQKFRTSIESLLSLLAETSEYSATARCTVMGLRSPQRQWLRTLF